MAMHIGHLAQCARDVEATVRFYTEVIGLEEAFRMNNPDGRLGAVYMRIAPLQFLEIFPGGTKTCSQGPDAIGLCHLCLQVDDIEAEYRRVKAAGALIDVEPRTGSSKALLFFTHDPDGNAIEFMQLPADSMQAQAQARLAGREG